MALAAEGCISKSELKDYIAKHDDLGVYHIKKIKLTSNPLSLDLLRSKGRFFPPQSFLFVSDDGAKELDTLLK
jgi:predicted transcriptional regulator